jgi:hypothetical protein
VSTRTSKAIASLVALAVLTVGLYSLTREREPRYQGKSLSAWLRAGGSWWGEAVDDRPAKAAVRNIGTNAIPSLLRMLRGTNSQFALKMASASQKLGVPRTILAPKVAEEENGLAMRGFEWLGPVACERSPSVD